MRFVAFRWNLVDKLGGPKCWVRLVAELSIWCVCNLGLGCRIGLARAATVRMEVFYVLSEYSAKRWRAEE